MKSLSINAPLRLAALKKYAAARNYSATWKTCRDSLKNHRGLAQSPRGWYSHDGAQLRNERDCSDIVRSLPKGWYTDNHQDGTAIGIVAGLPHGRFLAGYRWAVNDERVYYPEIFSDESDAAHQANGHAESFAGIERAYSEKFDEAVALESTINDSLQRLKECIVLRNAQCMQYVRDEITDLCATIRNSRETMRAEYSNYI